MSLKVCDRDMAFGYVVGSTRKDRNSFWSVIRMFLMKEGVVGQKVTPRVDGLSCSCREAGTLASGNVLESSRGVKAPRDLTITIFIPRSMAPKPAGSISARHHPCLHYSFFHLIWGVTSRYPDGMSLGKGHKVGLKQREG